MAVAFLPGGIRKTGTFSVLITRDFTTHDMVDICDHMTDELGILCAPLGREEGGIRIGKDGPDNGINMRFSGEVSFDHCSPICSRGDETLVKWRTDEPVVVLQKPGKDFVIWIQLKSFGNATTSAREMLAVERAFNMLGFRVI